MTSPTTTPVDTSGTVLVLNSGSSSIKFQLIRPDTGESLADGLIERIGEDDGHIRFRHTTGTENVHGPIPDHRSGMRTVLDMLDSLGRPLADVGIVAIGHRVVHGGAVYHEPVLVDDEVVRQIERLGALAPLHNPANAIGIRVAREQLPDVPNVVVFDTAFFFHLPPAAATYALEKSVAEKYRIRRYGFHGTSHEFVAGEAARTLGRDLTDLRIIVLHLGNGASASAIDRGRPVDTSMGMTPLEGLVMGTRTGDIDPGVSFYLARQADMSTDELDDLYNRKSGLKGLCGANDFREVLRMRADGDADASLAYDVYVHRLRSYIGAYTFVLGSVDAIVFTGGVGENSPDVRRDSLAGLGRFGIEVDDAANEANGGRGDARVVSTDASQVAVMVVPTDEELAIARAAAEVAATVG